MWSIIKFDKKNFYLLKNDLREKIGKDCIIYRPKILIKKYKNKKLVKKEFDIMGDYLFCFHKKFEQKDIIQKLRFMKGLKYFLNGFFEFQRYFGFYSKCKT